MVIQRNLGRTLGMGYVVISTAALSVAKQSDVVSDPVNLTVQPKAIPGAVIGYCVTISNTWIVAANNVIITDPIPVNQSYVSGSVYVGSTCLNAATVPPTTTFINNTLTITSLTLAAGATYAAIFRVVVN